MKEAAATNNTRYNAGCYIIKAVSCGIKDLDSAIPVALDEETIDIHASVRMCVRLWAE